MPIDDCTHTFASMATTVLPAYMDEMRAAMSNARPSSLFCQSGLGLKGLLSKLGRTEDFSGCYVLLHDRQPFYVGISRSVIQRLRQHLTGKTHYDASLAYMMAKGEAQHSMKRSEAMADDNFRRAFDEAQQLLRNCKLAFIEISNPLELYLFEAYCAMELDTCKWNTFRTH
ncbi:MAG: GIY-YIG nuclease family protein [Acidobacteriaceae bacterium]